jgi:hypothetical protein
LLNSVDGDSDVEIEVDTGIVGFDIGYCREFDRVDSNDVVTEEGFLNLCMDAIDSLEDC